MVPSRGYSILPGSEMGLVWSAPLTSEVVTGPVLSWGDPAFTTLGARQNVARDLCSPSPGRDRREEQRWTSLVALAKNPPAKVGGAGLIPALGRLPHAVEQLSPCATAIEPVLQRLGATTAEAREPESLCSATREASTVRGLSTATREPLPSPPLAATEEKTVLQQGSRTTMSKCNFQKKRNKC